MNIFSLTVDLLTFLNLLKFLSDFTKCDLNVISMVLCTIIGIQHMLPVNIYAFHGNYCKPNLVSIVVGACLTLYNGLKFILKRLAS